MNKEAPFTTTHRDLQVISPERYRAFTGVSGLLDDWEKFAYKAPEIKDQFGHFIPNYEQVIIGWVAEWVKNKEVQQRYKLDEQFLLNLTVARIVRVDYDQSPSDYRGNFPSIQNGIYEKEDLSPIWHLRARKKNNIFVMITMDRIVFENDKGVQFAVDFYSDPYENKPDQDPDISITARLCAFLKENPKVKVLGYAAAKKEQIENRLPEYSV